MRSIRTSEVEEEAEVDVGVLFQSNPPAGCGREVRELDRGRVRLMILLEHEVDQDLSRSNPPPPPPPAAAVDRRGRDDRELERGRRCG